MANGALITIATRHQAHYERLKSAEVNKYDKFLVEMIRNVTGQLKDDEITEYTRGRLEQQLKVIRSLLNDSFQEYRDVLKSGITEAALYESEFEYKTLDKVFSGVEFSAPSDNQITTAVFNTPLGDVGGIYSGELLEPFIDGLNTRTIKRIEGSLRIGYAQGKTNQQLIREIRGTKAAGFADGLAAVSKRDAEAMVRTAMQHASSVSREMVWHKNKKVISGVVIVAAIDSRTTQLCMSMDGKVFEVGKGPRPPFHINCRTTTSAKLAEKYEWLSTGRTRVVKDFQTGKNKTVSANKTFYDILKNEPAKVQDSIIGPARGKLLRDGGLSAKRFKELQLDSKFQPLTLDEMRKIELVAFEKAGL